MVYFAVQKCSTVTEKKFTEKNYEQGACNVNTDKEVVLDAGTTCKFACKDGYYHAKGNQEIAFTCAPNNKDNAKGTDNWDSLAKCKGA